MSDHSQAQLSAVPVPWKVHGLALVAPVIAVMALVMSYDSLPDPMPTHWNFRGEPDAWTEKSMQDLLVGVLLGPGIMVVALGFAAVMTSMISSSVTAPARLGGARTRTDALRTWHELAVAQNLMAWYSVAMSISLTVMMMGMSGPWEAIGGGVTVALGTLGMLAATVWLLVEMGRRGDAVVRKYPHSDGRRRKWLMFVDIPDGPEADKVMVDTGTGTNFTFNVATRGGRIGAIIMLAVLAGSAVLMLWVAVATLV